MVHASIEKSFDFDRPSLGDLAASLHEEVRSIAPLVDAAHMVGIGTSAVGTQAWIALAIIHAFWRNANVSPDVTAAVLSGWPEISASLEEVLCFRSEATDHESDPFLLFSPIASESIPVPAIDEYLDLVQNRFFVWRRPSIDRRSLGQSLLAGTGPDIEEDYLDALQKLKAKPSYDRLWLGYTDGRSFFRNERRQGPKGLELATSVTDLEHSSLSFEDSYACKISINVSLAAREMKRRALGLDVVS